MLDRHLQFHFGPALGCQPGMLHQAPHRLDAVEFQSVSRQEFEIDDLLLQEREHGSDGSSVMDEGVVTQRSQEVYELAAQIRHKAPKGLCGAGLPVVGVHDSAAAEQFDHDIEALLDGMLLTARRPGAAIGVNMSEASLAKVGQLDLAGLRSAFQPA